MARYIELQQLVAKYGEATSRLIKESWRFGDAIRDGLPAYLGCPADRVCGVPPQGEFRPGQDYRDAAYSFYHDSPNPTMLEPIIMGLYVEVSYAGRRGGTWVLLAIEFWIAGDDMVVIVHRNGRPVTVPIMPSIDLTPVFEEIYRELQIAFSGELDASNPKQTMGFIDRT